MPYKREDDNAGIRIISFLIKLNEDKDNMAYAVEKWKRDQEFLRGGIIGNTIKVAGVVM